MCDWLADRAWLLAVLVKPLGLVVLFGFTYFVSRFISRFIPEGKFKRFLFFRWKV
jgi:hypothetical protein